MKNLPNLAKYRRVTANVVTVMGSIGDDRNGVFDVPHPRTGVVLLVIASSGDDWDHVSVSLPNRCPDWEEMEYVKRMFFEDHETAMQLHVPPAEHKNLANTCLHIWRPQASEIPRPPAELVGARY